MIKPLILIIDDRPDTELAVRRAFDSEPVMIRQVQNRQDALLIADDIQILLVSANLQSEDSYELAADLANYYPSAALYFLVAEGYDAQLASESGALGYFKYPIDAQEIKESLAVFFNFDSVTTQTTLPPVSHIYFSGDYDFDDEAQVAEQLEQLIKLQLLTNVNLRQVIRRLVREFSEELTQSGPKS